MKKRNAKGQFAPKPEEIHLLRAYVTRMFWICGGFVSVVGAVSLILSFGQSHDQHEARDLNSSVTATHALNLAQQDSIRIDKLNGK